MVPLYLELQPRCRAERPPPDAEALSFLNHLRLVAMQCRAKARADLFEACALLSMDRTGSQAAHAEALMRCLNQALGQTARLHAPGTDELSFDEAWLMQLGRAVARGDEASTTFLLCSRIAVEHRRSIRFLVSRAAACFSLN